MGINGGKTTVRYFSLSYSLLLSHSKPFTLQLNKPLDKDFIQKKPSLKLFQISLQGFQKSVCLRAELDVTSVLL